MSDLQYDPEYLKKIVKWLDEKHLRLEEQLSECRKKNSKRQH